MGIAPQHSPRYRRDGKTVRLLKEEFDIVDWEAVSAN
jgi:hypothetical protein